MNKRTFLVAIAVVVICAMAGAGTMAYFTSQATSGGNAFETGTLILGGVINGEDVRETFQNVSIGNLRPGLPAVVGSTTLKNVGTLPFKLYRITAANFQLAANEQGVEWDELDDLLMLTVKIGGEHVYTGKFSELVKENGGFFDPIYDVFPGQTREMTFIVTMESSAGNRYQGLRFTCDFTVYAAQNNAPNTGEPRGKVYDLGSVPGAGTAADPTFSVAAWNSLYYANFDWDWEPNDSDYEEYEIKIKYESGSPDDSIDAVRQTIRIWIFDIDDYDIEIEGDGPIQWYHVLIDWSEDSIHILKAPILNAGWRGFQIQLSGTRTKGTPLKTITQPDGSTYLYWSLEDEVHQTAWE